MCRYKLHIQSIQMCNHTLTTISRGIRIFYLYGKIDCTFTSVIIESTPGYQFARMNM